MLIVCPNRLSTITDVKIYNGMEIAIIRVLRQLPRKSKIIKAVKQAAMMASRMTPLTAALTKID